MDDGAISISPTQPVYMTSGPFKGQMVAGDNNMGTLQRYSLEKVAGEWQGAIFRFSGSLDAAANRIMTGPDGAFYVGELGTEEWSGWAWSGKNYGLQRLAPNGKAFFDMFAVRSLGSGKLEIEFTEPAGDAAGMPANYKVQQWNYTPVLDYGKGKQAPVTNLSVKTATLSADKKKVTLEIDGMKVKNVVYLKLSNIAAANGDAIVGTEAWYTQNAFGPGTDPVVPTTEVRAGSRPLAAPRFSARSAAGGRWSIAIQDAGVHSLEILDLNGRLLETATLSGASEFLSRSAYGSGLYLARVRGPQGAVSSQVLCAGK
ncbi:MAG: T9SS type A sorting domain-containing protein [Fibrobacteres bacterium]|nr:T9SS type A sorting domain-containing protein [Fibrobacterota bacterium]